MMSEGETVVLDLDQVRSKEQLIDLLGEKLEFGGPGGNHTVTAVDAGKGWGRNWDALKDSLACLDSGGIWGTSRQFRFPLRIQFANSTKYRKADPEGFETLAEILGEVQGIYAKDGMRLRYEFS
jgi:hypothetical protein